LTIEKRLPGSNLFTVAYVGTQGRHLPQNVDQNIIPVGRLLSGTLNGLDLSSPIQRAALDPASYRSLRPYSAYQNVRFYQFTGTSSYHSLQATLSHQSGKYLQYFATYTFSKALGTVATNESDGAAFADRSIRGEGVGAFCLLTAPTFSTCRTTSPCRNSRAGNSIIC